MTNLETHNDGQLTLDLSAEPTAKTTTCEVLRNILREKGPCRFLQAFCEPGQPDDTYEVFCQMREAREIVAVDVLHFPGSPGTLGFKDEVWDLAERAARHAA